MNNSNLENLFRKELDQIISNFSVEELAIRFLEKHNYHLTYTREEIDSLLAYAQNIEVSANINHSSIHVNESTSQPVL